MRKETAPVYHDGGYPVIDWEEALRNCRMNACDRTRKCCWPDNCGPEGFITLGRLIPLED